MEKQKPLGMYANHYMYNMKVFQWVVGSLPNIKKNGDNFVVTCFLFVNQTASKFMSQVRGFSLTTLAKALKEKKREERHFNIKKAYPKKMFGKRSKMTLLKNKQT